MKRWKRALSITCASLMAFSAIPSYALAYTNSEGKEGIIKDGKYQGTARGYKSDVTVEVEVADGKIAAINVLEQDESKRPWSKAVAIIDTIISEQNVDVDGVSGATYSCDAIKNATKSALDKAFEEKASEPVEPENPENPETPEEPTEPENPENPENPDDKKDEESIFASGEGTKEAPYTITSEKELRAFATSLSKDNSYEGKYVELLNDINLEAGDWTPVGEGEYPFNGDFDGRGHKISGLAIGSSDNHYKDNGAYYYALFGVIEKEAYIHDLTVDANIYVESDANILLGGIAGYSEGVIDSCTVNGNIWGKGGIKDTDANVFAAGITAYTLRGAVTNCVNNASIYSQATGGIAEAGGIIGLNNRTLLANCIGNGKITGTADRELEGMASIGGIAGVHAGTMTSCVANADVESYDYSMYVGTLAGWATGIGYLYYNYYNPDNKELIEGKQVSPVEAVGWIVGPGTSDEGWDYEGGLNVAATAVEGGQINSEALADKINGTFSEYPAQISDFSSKVALRKWVVADGAILPAGERTGYTYKEVVIEKKEEEEEPVIDVTGKGKVNPAIFDGGDGTEQSPYLIATEQQLINFNKSIGVDEDFAGLYVALKNDITLTKEWKLAGGNTPYPFSGVFDGKGHTISNLKIGSKDAPASYQYAGLFPYLKGAIVKDLKINGARIYTKTDDSSRYYAGVLTAVVESAGMEGCVDSVEVSDAVVNVQTNSGAVYAAGLIGSDQVNVIANCKVDADVTANSKAGWDYAGILTGLTARSAIINNRVSGTVSVSANLNKAAAGGLGGMVASLVYSNAADVAITSERYTNDLGEISGRTTGISYIATEYFNKDAKVVCGENTVETKGIGTAVAGSSEGSGAVSNLQEFAAADFNSDALLTKLNDAAKADEYKTVLGFLKDNWGIDFEKSATIKPWKTSQAAVKPAPQPTPQSGSQSSSQSGSSSNQAATTKTAAVQQAQATQQAAPAPRSNQHPAAVATANAANTADVEDTEDTVEDKEVADGTDDADSVAEETEPETIEEELAPQAAEEAVASEAGSPILPAVVVVLIAIVAAAGLYTVRRYMK